MGSRLELLSVCEGLAETTSFTWTSSDVRGRIVKTQLVGCFRLIFYTVQT